MSLAIRVVNGNGEILNKEGDTVFIVTANQLTSQKRYRQATENGRGHAFTFTNMEGIREVIRTLDDKYCGYLLFLQCFLDYDGVLVKGQKQKIPMTKVDIAQTLGLKERAFRDFFKTLTEYNVLLIENNVFKINGEYHWKGSAKVERYIKTFTTEVKKLFGIFKPKDLGFIYKLLPYVHFETNLLCENPHERDLSKIRPLNKSDIAEVVGVDASTAFRKIQKIKLNDMYVFAEVSKGGIDNIYKINPFIFYRQNGKPDKSLLTDFILRG